MKTNYFANNCAANIVKTDFQFYVTCNLKADKTGTLHSRLKKRKDWKYTQEFFNEKLTKSVETPKGKRFVNEVDLL